MPHQCTTCGRTFSDGSKGMLGGCPDCGGNKFQFLPSGAVEDPDGPPDVDAPSEPAADPSAGDPAPSPADHGPDAAAGDREDRAQASARGAVASPDELPSAGAVEEHGPDPDPEPQDDRPGIAALREELNEQFESIKIVEPGQYELNLMELYDREEYIVAIEEDGRYVIDVPSVDFEDPEGRD